MTQTTETVPPEREGHPSESVQEIVEHAFELPLAAQLGVLRTLAPKILRRLDAEQRAGFVRDLNVEIAHAQHGDPTYDVRPPAAFGPEVLDKTPRERGWRGEHARMRCDVCGNEYDKAFKVLGPHGTRTFDCFECAVEALSPRCAHCKVRILGHGLEKEGRIFCCAHCAHAEGATELRDRA